MELLQRAFTEALGRNAAETVRWTQYKELHEGARANIENFQKFLTVDIMVPIGTKALIPGRIYHTNEILVSHSGTHYSKCSAHKAMEICQHRLEVAAKRLDALMSEAEMYRNKLELPSDYEAFSSNGTEEIIEEYDEEEEKRWREVHRKKMKEHKLREAEERKLLTSKTKDDIIQTLDELELMEELEVELETVAEVDDDAIRAILNRDAGTSSHKKRIAHQNIEDRLIDEVPNIDDISFPDTESLTSESEDFYSDDDDVAMEFKKIENDAKNMSYREKSKFFRSKLSEVENYLQTFKPKTIEDISVKTDKMFLVDHLVSAIESIEDELNCDNYLNAPIKSDPEMKDQLSSTTKLISTVLPRSQTKPILKKNRNKNDSQKRISFAVENDIKSFDLREEPSKISTTIKFEHGPVLQCNINHSENVNDEKGDDLDPDVIRSPTDIYKLFANCKLSKEKLADLTLKERECNPSSPIEKNLSSHETIGNICERKPAETIANIRERKPAETIGHTHVQRSAETIDHTHEQKPTQAENQDIIQAKIEVKEMLDNMFSQKTDEPDPLPEGRFVDAHQPKKRISLFKTRRQMKDK